MERHLDVPRASVTWFERHVQQIRCSSWAGPGTGTVRTLANLFSFVREFIEVILLQPRQAWRWISLGNRESCCDAT